MNERAWAIWCLYETKWELAPMGGGIIGWGGHDAALKLLVHGYKVSGGELLAEVERLKIMENAQLEIESARRKRAREIEEAKKRGAVNVEGVEHTEGELDDFFEDAIWED